jgi:hypothetical protein
MKRILTLLLAVILASCDFLNKEAETNITIEKDQAFFEKLKNAESQAVDNDTIQVNYDETLVTYYTMVNGKLKYIKEEKR